jgi:hypothetical protein
LTRISGANDREPFAFVSLVLCPRQRHVFVAIEIIPPARTVLNGIDAVENILKRFIDSCHPIWQNRSVTVMERAPEPPPAPAQPRGTGPQPQQPRQAAPQSSSQPHRIVPPPLSRPNNEFAQQQQVRTEQEALATFACSSGPLPPEIEQRFVLPEGTPFLGEDELAQVIAEVLLEDIETNGDPFLEEILAGIFDETAIPTMDFPTPPDVVPHDLITPPNLPPVNKPPRPSTEPHLPPLPCEYGRPENPKDEEKNYLERKKQELDDLHSYLFSFPSGLYETVWRLERMKCPSCGHTIFDARGCMWDSFRLNAANNRNTVKRFYDESDRYNREVRQFKDRVATFNKKINDWENWCKWYNTQIDEYNRCLRSEQDRINREQREWVERFNRENKQWVEQVQQQEKQWHEAIEHHSRNWIEWAVQQGQQWVDRINQVGQQRNGKTRQMYQKWLKQIEDKLKRLEYRPDPEKRQWLEQVQREQQQWHERIEQEQRQWNEHVAREVQQWNERLDRLIQQWRERHQRLIQQWNERAEQLARQWGDTDERPDPQWYDHVQRECREWRDQPAREWQQWGEQLAREAQQMREQVERDRQQICERSQQGRKEQAEQYLEGRTADLLGQAHARAHYGACQASMFPLPSARPARPSSGSRPRAPSPPPAHSLLRTLEEGLHISGHEGFIRTRIRRFLRNTVGLEQRDAQAWAEAADCRIDLAIIKGIKLLWGMGPGGVAAAVGVGVVEHQRVIRGTLYDFSGEVSKRILTKIHNR